MSEPGLGLLAAGRGADLGLACLVMNFGEVVCVLLLSGVPCGSRRPVAICFLWLPISIYLKELTTNSQGNSKTSEARVAHHVGSSIENTLTQCIANPVLQV